MDSHNSHKAFIQMVKWLESRRQATMSAVVPLVHIWFQFAMWKLYFREAQKQNSNRVIGGFHLVE